MRRANAMAPRRHAVYDIAGGGMPLSLIIRQRRRRQSPTERAYAAAAGHARHCVAATPPPFVAWFQPRHHSSRRCRRGEKVVFSELIWITIRIQVTSFRSHS